MKTESQKFIDKELEKFVIPRAGQFCALQTDAVRRQIWITPNKRSAVRGIDSALPELRSSSTPYGVVSERYTYPELRFACTGLSKLDAYGVKRHEVSLHFYITILARAQYNRFPEFRVRYELNENAEAYFVEIYCLIHKKQIKNGQI